LTSFSEMIQFPHSLALLTETQNICQSGNIDREACLLQQSLIAYLLHSLLVDRTTMAILLHVLHFCIIVWKHKTMLLLILCHAVAMAGFDSGTLRQVDLLENSLLTFMVF